MLIAIAILAVYLLAGLFVAAVCGLRRKSEPTELHKVYDSREGGWLGGTSEWENRWDTP